MRELCDHLYYSMMQDCEHCRKKQLYIMQELGCCFQICTRYWAIVRDHVAKYEFKNANEEIDFFRNIKPLFLSEIEYLGYVSFAELSKEKETDSNELEKFWNNEALRMEKFINANKSFYDYYKSGSSENDEIYFTRINSDLSNFLKAKPYDLDSNASTSHDYLVASILALEKYQTYLKQQISIG